MKKCLAVLATALVSGAMLLSGTGCNQKSSAFVADDTTYTAQADGATYTVRFASDGTASESVSYLGEDGSLSASMTGTYVYSEADSTLTFTLVSAEESGSDVTEAFGDDLTGVYSVQKDGSSIVLTAVSGMSFLDPDGTGTSYSAE